MGLPFALWERKAIQEAIKKMWRINIAIRTVGDYLKRWGYSAQKPSKRAYERAPKAVKQWHDETYPAIKNRAKSEDCEIMWGDETGIKNHCQHARGYAPKAQTPVLEISAKRFSVNMVSAITNRGTVRFMLYEETMTAQVFIRFLQQLISGATRKIFLILDNLLIRRALASPKQHISLLTVQTRSLLLPIAITTIPSKKPFKSN